MVASHGKQHDVGAVAVFAPHPLPSGTFHLAGLAPVFPAIQDHFLAAVLAQRDFITPEAIERKVGRTGAEFQGCFGLFEEYWQLDSQICRVIQLAPRTKRLRGSLLKVDIGNPG